MLYSLVALLVLTSGVICEENAKSGIQSLVDAMLEVDEDRPKNYEFNWGNRVDGVKPVSHDNLYKTYDKNVFNKRQYKALIDIYNNKVFHREVCSDETPMKGFRKKLIDEVFDAFTETPMFNLTLKYLQDKQIAGEWNEFRDELFSFWFGSYSRCGQTVSGSSGWEHVFVGEFKKSKVDGHHSWVSYVLEEESGHVKYHGYLDHHEKTIGTIQYKWNNKYLKRIGGFLMSTSPAFDFSLFTACSLAHTGPHKCKFSIDGFPLSVTSYIQSCKSGRCLATAYPCS